jgi:hypothetical protein
VIVAGYEGIFHQEFVPRSQTVNQHCTGSCVTSEGTSPPKTSVTLAEQGVAESP